MCGITAPPSSLVRLALHSSFKLLLAARSSIMGTINRGAPGTLMAALAGGAEFFGGLLLIAGFLVRPSAVVLAITMLVAIVTVHLPNGLFMSNNGYEFGLALLVISIGLAVRGAGSLSIDSLLQNKLSK